jgi:hypothetical protein
VIPTQLNPKNLPPMERNKGLMTAFISAHLPGRVGLNTRRSVVLYDGNFCFNYALEQLPGERMLRRLYKQTPVRYWSKGI